MTQLEDTCITCGSKDSAYSTERVTTDEDGEEISYELSWCDNCLKVALDRAIQDTFISVLPEIRNLLAEIASKLDKLL